MTKKFMEIKDWFEENEETIKLCCVGVGCELVCLVAGIAIGKSLEDIQISKGLEKCFEIDPTFKEHYANVIAEKHKNDILK
jgi:hypothetical protein